MADKTFNEKPMVVVVSDALDPRTKRQLQAQLQSEMMTISQVDAEIKNAQSMENIKQQYDANKDASEFDEDDTKEQPTPEPIESSKANENTPPDQTNTSNSGNAEKPDPFTGGENGPTSEEGNSGTDKQGGNASDAFDGGNEGNDQSNGGQNEKPVQPVQSNDQNNQQQQAGQTQPAQANQAQQSGGDDLFKDSGNPEAGQAQGETPAPQNQATGNDQSQQSQQQQNQIPNGDKPDAAEGDDPFADNQPTFEAFAGILGIPVKFENAEKQTSEEALPPMKQLTVIRGSNRGVDDRTNGVIAALEDPQNTIVVVDLTDVSEAEAKMQFQSIKKQMQERGITVVDTIDQAVDFLNEVYDQIAGKGKSAE